LAIACELTYLKESETEKASTLAFAADAPDAATAGDAKRPKND